MAIPKTPFTRFRLQTFPDLTTANASNKLFGYGDIICIIGDNTRFKMGMGLIASAKNPPVPTALTFANLPWVQAAVQLAGAYAAPITATLTAAQLLQRYIVTTSAAATALTLPTAALLAAALSAIQGSEIDFTIDNTGGANIVTIAVATGIVVGAGALTGNTTLTVAAGQVARFKIFFKSATAALLYRTL